MAEDSFIKTMIRFLIYTAVIVTGLAALPLAVSPADISRFRESSDIENIQALLLLATVACYIFAYLVGRNRTPLLLLLAALTCCALIREFDAFLDNLFPALGWQFFVAGILVFALGLSIKKRKQLLPDIYRFARTRSFGILWVGFIITVAFSQLVGHREFLESLMGDDYERGYKRVIEESCELLGYFIFLLGSWETIVQVRAWERKPQEDQESVPNSGC